MRLGSLFSNRGNAISVTGDGLRTKTNLPGTQVHHIIPRELWADLGISTIDGNSPANVIVLPKNEGNNFYGSRSSYHSGSHPGFTEYVRNLFIAGIPLNDVRNNLLNGLYALHNNGNHQPHAVNAFDEFGNPVAIPA